MLVSVRVATVGLDRSSNTPVVVLQELQGERVLSIWIGPCEAGAIAARLTKTSFQRPLTHDLLAQILSRLGGHLDSVTITHDGKNLFFAELLVKHGDEALKIDARPSDSIPLALDTNADIFVDDSLLGSPPPALEQADPQSTKPEVPHPEE